MKAGALLLLMIAFFSISLVGQTKISGTVTTATGTAINNVNVLLLHAIDSSLVKGAVTSVQGEYLFTGVQAGRYILCYTYVGYKQNYSDALIALATQKEIAIANVQMAEEKQELQNVTVLATRPLFEQRIDRMVVNVKNTITASGGTALDILERSPGVIVNRQSNTITMNGKNGVVVMINGKVSRLPLDAVVQMLEGMSSANIERMELINTPPSNYDAEGNAGFINIVTTTNTQNGTSGNYSASLGYGGKERGQVSLNINHRQGRLNVYGDYSFLRNHLQQQFTFSRKFQHAGKTTETSSDSYRDPIQNNHNGRIGLDYELNKKTTVGGLLSFYNNRWTMDANTSGIVKRDDILDTVINITNGEKNTWKHLSAGINLQHIISDGQKLLVNVDYLNYDNSNPNTYHNLYYSGAGALIYSDKINSAKNTPIHVWVAGIDYTKNLGKKIDVEAGVKGTISRFTNDVNINRLINNNWLQDASLSAVYFLQENIGAAYSSMNIAWSEKLSMKLGLRYEHTSSNLETATQKNIVDRKYGRLFPSFFLSRKITEKQSINLSYSRRITRPTFNQLAPFVYFFDPSTFIQGNPALQPSFSHNVKADYIINRNVFSISYSMEKDVILRFQSTIDPASNKQTITGENVPSLQLIAASFSIPLTFTKWWSMQSNILVTHQEVKAIYERKPLKFQQVNGRINVTETFTLPKNIIIELSGYYQSPNISGRFKNKGVGTLNFGIQKKVQQKKGTIRISVTDILNTSPWRFEESFADPTFFSNGRLQFVQRTFNITYSRSFGNDKIKASRVIKGAEEEKRRVE